MPWQFTLDGVDITNISYEKSWTRGLNRMSSAKCRVPASLSISVGITRLQVVDASSNLRFNGVVWRADDAGGEDDYWTNIQAYDALIYFPMKLVYKDCDTGEDPDCYPTTIIPGSHQTTIFEDYEEAGLIMEAAINNSIASDEGFADTFGYPYTALGYEVGTVDVGLPVVSGRPTDWPMTLEDLRRYMVETGTMDIFADPLPNMTQLDGSMTEINLYEGPHGNNLTGSVIFGYGTAPFNVSEFNRSRDMSTVANALRYYLGPRLDDDTDGDARYCGSITLCDPDLADPCCCIGSEDLFNWIVAARTAYGRIEETRIYDGYTKAETDLTNPHLCGDCEDGTDCDDPENVIRKLFQKIWNNESLLRATPRTLITFKPKMGEQPDFDVGDVITLQWGAVIGGEAVSGAIRVYEFTVEIDEEGVPQMSITVSSDGDAV